MTHERAVATELSSWSKRRPYIAVDLTDALSQIVPFLQTGRDLIDELSSRCTSLTDSGIDTLSTARAALLETSYKLFHRHSEEIYGTVTQQFAKHLTIAELIDSVADAFPGVFASKAQRLRESQHSLSDKRGYDREYANFLHFVLRSDRCGRHLLLSTSRPCADAMSLLSAFRSDARVQLSTVLVQRVGTAGHVTFMNGAVLNAESNQLIRDLEVAIDLVLLDDQIEVGMLRGGRVDHPKYKGKRVFSAGIDLKALRKGEVSFLRMILGREFGYLNKIARGIHRGDAYRGNSQHAGYVSKPWLAVVEAFAIGGGAQLLLVCDRVLAEESSYFSLPAGAEGLVPGFANMRLPTSAGTRVARQVILFGRKILASDCDSHNVFDEVVHEESIESQIELTLAQMSSPAFRANRRLLKVAEEPIPEFLEYASEFVLVQAERLESADLIKRLSVFADRNAPKADLPRQKVR